MEAGHGGKDAAWESSRGWERVVCQEVYLLSADIFNLLTTWDKKRERISGIGKTAAGLEVWVKVGRVFCQIRGTWTLGAGGEEVAPCGSLVNSSASFLWRTKSNRSKIPFRTVLRPWQHCHLLCFVQSLPTVCDPRDCSTPRLPVHHLLSDLTQTQVHCVRDAIQPFHPLSSPSPAFFFSLSQDQGLF